MKRFKKHQRLCEDSERIFPVNKVQYFELNAKGLPTKRMHRPPNKFFIEKKSQKKVAVTLSGLLATDEYVAMKQAYLMQIMQVEKDVQRAKYIYHNWDWVEFLTYMQSLLSVRVMEN